MGLSFYKANKASAGSACQVSFNSKGAGKGVFVELIKQTGWDDANKTGTFKEGAKVNVKLSLPEVGEILYCIKNFFDLEKPFFHKSDSGSSSIFFSRAPVYEKNPKTNKMEAVEGQWRGFKLGVTKSEENFGIGLTFGEVTLLEEYLKFALEHCFSGIYAEDKEKAKDYADRKEKEAGGSKPNGKGGAKVKSAKDFVNTDGNHDSIDDPNREEEDPDSILF